MQNVKFNILLTMFVLFISGVGNSFAQKGETGVKIPKNMGTLTVRTTPQAFPVKVDGKVLGMSGVSEPANFNLAPGTYQLEVEGPGGKTFVKQIEIRKASKNCVCLKMIEETTSRACPYNVRLDGPERVMEGDLITFASFNSVTTGAIPVNYNWTVVPGNLNITSGLGTPSITVDTTGFGGQTITADLDVNDGVYDATCRQKISVPTIVEPKPPLPTPRRFDKFESNSFDDDKAKLDLFVIELQNNPDAQGYIVMYQGTDRTSIRSRNVDVLSKRTLDYLVKSRGIDPSRIVITNWGKSAKTVYDLWIVPSGAQPPVPE